MGALVDDQVHPAAAPSGETFDWGELPADDEAALPNLQLQYGAQSAADNSAQPSAARATAHVNVGQQTGGNDAEWKPAGSAPSWMPSQR